MFTVYGRKTINIFVDAQLMREFHDATGSVSAKCAFFSVAVVIYHAEVDSLLFNQHHESVGTDARLPLAKPVDLLVSEFRRGFRVSVKNDEIVACALVFVEFKFHCCCSWNCFGFRNKVESGRTAP
jgi:hypothetical protein